MPTVQNDMFISAGMGAQLFRNGCSFITGTGAQSAPDRLLRSTGICTPFSGERKDDVRNKRQYIWVAFYILCLLYITIFSRVPSLVRTIRPIPFWSYINLLQGNWDKGLSNCLNIGLFVPLGYLLTNFRKSKWLPIIGCLIATVSIEVIQYITYFGYFDADDIISNFIGGCIGVAAWHLVDKRLPNNRKLIPRVLIIAGLIGCIITSKNVQYYETQLLSCKVICPFFMQPPLG
jgi:glycopeptide antibiotics resistance protein